VKAVGQTADAQGMSKDYSRTDRKHRGLRSPRNFVLRLTERGKKAFIISGDVSDWPLAIDIRSPPATVTTRGLNSQELPAETSYHRDCSATGKVIDIQK
jgi:hypothetical protein